MTFFILTVFVRNCGGVKRHQTNIIIKQHPVIYDGWDFIHDRVISLRGELWAHKTSLTPPLFIEVSVPSQESERSCIFVLFVSILPLSTMFLFDFGVAPTVFFFLFYYSSVSVW